MEPWEEPSSWAGATEDGGLGWRDGPSHSRQEMALGAKAAGAGRPRLEAEAVWLCSPGQVGDRKDSALKGRKGKGSDCWRADRAPGWLHSYSGPGIPRASAPEHQRLKTDALADPVDAKSLASRICYPEFPERPLLGALHTQRPTAFLSPVPGSTHPCCFCSDQTWQPLQPGPPRLR